MAKLLDDYGARFKNKTFTLNEIDYCDFKSNPAIHFAGRFAAKESGSLEDFI